MDNIKELFTDYLMSLTTSVPVWVYEASVYSFIIGLVLVVAIKGWRSGLALSSKLFLVIYFVLLLSSTVFFREVKTETAFNFRPFWSYEAIHNGVYTLLPEIAMNVAAFVPIGLVLGFAFPRIKMWHAILIGLGASLLIESFQLFFYKGCSETDDVIHNTLGCILGYTFFMFARWGFRSIAKCISKSYTLCR